MLVGTVWPRYKCVWRLDVQGLIEQCVVPPGEPGDEAALYEYRQVSGGRSVGSGRSHTTEWLARSRGWMSDAKRRDHGTKSWPSVRGSRKQQATGDHWLVWPAGSSGRFKDFTSNFAPINFLGLQTPRMADDVPQGSFSSAGYWKF